MDKGALSLSLSLSMLCYLCAYFSLFSDIYFFQAKELDANTESYIELLAKGTGKTKEEISKDVQRPKYFQAQEAIDYGLVDKIIDSRDAAFEKRVLFLLPFTILFP